MVRFWLLLLLELLELEQNETPIAGRKSSFELSSEIENIISFLISFLLFDSSEVLIGLCSLLLFSLPPYKLELFMSVNGRCLEPGRPAFIWCACFSLNGEAG